MVLGRLPVRDGWQYLDGAGHAQELVRQDVQADRWKIEVRALEFRQYLAARGRDGVFQIDHVPWADLEEFPRVDDEFRNDWAHFSFCAVHDPSPLGGKPAFSRLLGRYLVRGARNSRVPRFEEWDQDHEYPEFIYGTDRETGQPLSHTCDPQQLGTYFDKDGHATALPDARLLQTRGAAALRRRARQVRPVGDAAVVPGPVGRRHLLQQRRPCRGLPRRPRVQAARGGMGPLEVLQRPASGKDGRRPVPPRLPEPTRQLQRPRRRPAARPRQGRDVSETLLGSPVWKPLPADAQAEFESLVGPLSDSPAALGQALLVLTKTLVDGIDPAPLKKFLVSYEKDERSLSLLGRFSEALGGDSELIAVFRKLQGFRSAGGVAHLAGSGRAKAAADLGVTGLTAWDAFESVATRLTTSLTALTELMVDRTQQTRSRYGLQCNRLKSWVSLQTRDWISDYTDPDRVTFILKISSIWENLPQLRVQVPPRTRKLVRFPQNEQHLNTHAGRPVLTTAPASGRAAASCPGGGHDCPACSPRRPRRQSRPSRPGQVWRGPSDAAGQPAGPTGRGLRVRPDRRLGPGRGPGDHRRAGLARR